ncbi:MAG: tRNA preQ1(34) S-adenosylmethionine ribosyltransferase-isomerase QueA [Acidobacteriaceae bacterium]|jgi:S-adenosylmethionine:tRNA ribosyltransferase-isomerase|nr:tRNA preQ1(34) S-adenosylmethionine ribosyltransferase-isomerase QueA [Acidobacteriaceae bacterium]
MLVSDFDFDLPLDQIAQEPPAQRGTSRLLCLSRATGAIAHTSVASLPDLLRPRDLLVVNNTRVFPARLLGHRSPSGGAVECLLVAKASTHEAQTPDCEYWEALVSPGQKLKPGARMIFAGSSALHGEILERRLFGRRLVALRTVDGTAVEEAIDEIGHMPLPPYIKRADRLSDRERYQTVFARPRGSIAAPTAGLHFTPELLASLTSRGIERVEITLHVGYGTFQPVRVDRVEQHAVAPERYEITPEAAETIERARADGRRVIAVGTTTTRTLEAVALANGGRVVAGAGEAALFIYPGFDFQVIDGLLTNFHLPQSSLLMLVAAFAGREQALSAYRDAVASGYRFYSYGDAMLIL